MIFRPFPRFVGPMSAAALGHCNGRVDKALFFVQHVTRAKFVGDVSQNSAQNLAPTPSLKPAMNRFVIRITLRQHAPLRAGVQNPQRRFKIFPRRNRLPTRAPLGNVLFRKMMPDTLPIRIVRESSYIVTRALAQFCDRF
jgi:hypothetical protein